MKDFKNVLFLTLLIYGILQSFFSLNSNMSTLSSGVGFLIFLELGFIVIVQSINRDQRKRLFGLDIYFIITYFLLFTSYSILSNNYDSYLKIFQLIKFFTLLLLINYTLYSEIPSDFIHKLLLTFNVLIFVSILLARILLGKFSYGSYYGGNEYFGYFQNPHMIGMGLLSLVIYFLYRFLHDRKVYFLIFFLADVSLIYLFQIRTYFLGMLITLCYLIFFSKYFSRRIKWLSALIIIVLAFALISGDFSLNSLSNRTTASEFILGKSQTQILAAESSGRTDFWIELVRYYFTNSSIFKLLFGYGQGGSQEILTKTIDLPIGAHNDWITLLVENGLSGLLFILGFYLYSFRKIVSKVRQDKNFILALIIAYFVSSIFNGTFYYTYSLIIFFLVMIYFKNINQIISEI